MPFCIPLNFLRKSWRTCNYILIGISLDLLLNFYLNLKLYLEFWKNGKSYYLVWTLTTHHTLTAQGMDNSKRRKIHQNKISRTIIKRITVKKKLQFISINVLSKYKKTLIEHFNYPNQKRKSFLMFSREFPTIFPQWATHKGSTLSQAILSLSAFLIKMHSGFLFTLPSIKGFFCQDYLRTIFHCPTYTNFFSRIC